MDNYYILYKFLKINYYDNKDYNIIYKINKDEERLLNEIKELNDINIINYLYDKINNLYEIKI